MPNRKDQRMWMDDGRLAMYDVQCTAASAMVLMLKLMLTVLSGSGASGCAVDDDEDDDGPDDVLWMLIYVRLQCEGLKRAQICHSHGWQHRLSSIIRQLS